MKCFPTQKRNYDIETLIPDMPNVSKKNHCLFIFHSVTSYIPICHVSTYNIL